MDVEKLKKMNFLIKELKDKGFATSSEDAYGQADSVYHIGEQTGNAYPAPEVPQESQRIQPNPSQNGIPTGQPMTPPPMPSMVSGSLEEARMKMVLEQHTQKYDQHINSLKAEIEQINMLLSTVRMELKKLQDQPRAAPVVTQSSSTVSVPSASELRPMPAAPAPVAEKPKESHPRGGDYRPEDVSMEKMFYFGSGR